MAVVDADRRLGGAARVDEMGRGGRYFVVEKPDGSEAHVLGVVPGSTVSERDFAALLESVQPKSVYVDLNESELELVKSMYGSDRSVLQSRELGFGIVTEHWTDWGLLASCQMQMQHN